MARVVFGPIVTAVRGKVGGVVFSAGHSGPYLKSFMPPVRTKSEASTTRRTTFSGPGAAWAAMALSDRADWRTWAADAAQEKTDPLGNPYYASGWAWFVALWQQAYSTGQTPQLTAPTLTRPIGPALSALAWTSSPGSEITATFAAGLAEDLYLVLRTSITSKSNALLPGNVAWRIVAAGPGTGVSTSLVFSGLEAVFGTVSAGQQYTIQASFQNLECDRGSETTWTGTIT